LIKFENVDKIYPNGVKGLKDISLEIEQGEFVAIIGLSGAGKSTLLRTINKMHDITSGKLTVNGQDVKKLKGKELRIFRRKIGMIFQSFNLITRASVIKNVLTSRVPELPLWKCMIGLFSKEDKIIALEALDKVGILEKAYIRADQLSGGQQQRVALARTLAQNPEIILADEPVAALDPVTAQEVMNDFKRINKEMNISIIINIHHVDLALEYADRVIGIKEGKIIYDGPTSPFIILGLIIVIYISVELTGFKISTIIKNGHQFIAILKDMIPPNWGYAQEVIKPLKETIQMSLVGSLVGSLVAIPFSILASVNVNHNKPLLLIVRLFLSMVRTLPTLIIALVATYIFDLGPFAGTVAISIFTFGIVAKMIYEKIETVDMGPFEAAEAIGATRLKAFIAAIIPQILPSYLSNCLYCFEINVRYAAILGYVGAGGIGLVLNEKIGWREYDKVGMILLMLFVTVIIIEYISKHIRGKLR